MTLATFEPRSVARSSFRERVHALVGRSTWREPLEGHSTVQRQIPSEHLVAAALSFGRRMRPGPAGRLVPDMDDIGPDIAFDIATGRPGHHRRVCAVVGKAFAQSRTSLVRRNMAHVGLVVLAGYHTVVGLPRVPRPAEVSEEDWGDMVAAACSVLESLAEDALSRAERRARRAA